MYTPNLNFIHSIEQIKSAISKQFDNIDYLNDVYRLYKRQENQDNIFVKEVLHSDLEKFCIHFDSFNKKIEQEDRHNDILYSVILHLARFRFKTTKTPLPFSHESFSYLDDEKKESNLARIKNLFPSYYEEIILLSDEMNKLRNLNDNPLLDKLINSSYEGRLLQAVSNNFAIIKDYVEKESNNKIIVSSGDDLKKGKVDDNLCILGHPSWVADQHIFAAPKYEKLHVILYDFSNSAYNNTPQLVQTLGNINILSTPGLEQSKKHSLTQAIYNPDEHLSAMNIEYVKTRFGHYSSDISQKNILNCRLALLSGDKIAYFTNEKGIDESQKVMEFDDNNNIVIKSKKVKEFTRGEIVIMRAGTTENIIVQYADTILGNKSQEYRDSQKKWKEKLISTVEQKGGEGIKVVSRELRKLGIKHAFQGNIKRWMGEKNMMLDDMDNFKILMTYVGFGGQTAEKVYEDMKIILSSHLSAAKQISKELLRKIRESNLDELGQKGWQEFELEHTGAKLGLFTILEIEDHDTQMPGSMCDRPLEMEKTDD